MKDVEFCFGSSVLPVQSKHILIRSFVFWWEGNILKAEEFYFLQFYLHFATYSGVLIAWFNISTFKLYFMWVNENQREFILRTGICFLTQTFKPF